MTERYGKSKKDLDIHATGMWPLPRPLRVFFNISGVILVLILVVLSVFYIGFVGRDISLPNQFNEFLQSQVSSSDKLKKFEFKNTLITVQPKNLKPIVTLTKVKLETANSGKVQFPVVKVELSLIDLLKGDILPINIELVEPEVKISRFESGTLGFGFFNNVITQPSVESTNGVINSSWTKFLNEPVFSRLEKINTKKLKLLYENERNGERISFIDGQAKLVKQKNYTEISLFASLRQSNSRLAKFSLFLRDRNRGQGSKLSLKFDDLDSSNLSNQVYSLGWFKHFDGLVSGAISGAFKPTGQIAEFAGAVTLENGYVRNLSGKDSYFLNSLNTHIRYNSKDQRMHFDNILILAPELKLNGEGHADISNFILGAPDTFVGQLTFNEIQLDLDGLFVEPVKFNDGLLDFRYNLSQSEMEIGQLLLRTDVSELTSSGLVSSKKDGWNIRLDTKLNEVEYKNLLDLWPINFKPKSRLWFSEKVKAGKIKNAISSIRIVPNQDTEVMTTFDFLDTEIEVLRGHPNLKNALGYGSIHNRKFFVKLNKGVVDGLDGREINLENSEFFVADTKKKPAIGEFQVFAVGETKDILTDLNKKPVKLLANSKLRPSDLNGISNLKVDLVMPLKKDLKITEISFKARNNIENFKSDTVVKGRLLSAKNLFLISDNEKFNITGNAYLDSFPVHFSWNKKLNPKLKGYNSINGKLTLSNDSFKQLNIEMPNDIMSGEADGNFSIKWQDGEKAKVTVSSDLKGIELNLKPLEWVKNKDVAGKFNLTLVLDKKPKDIKFELAAAKLKTSAEISFFKNEKFKDINFLELEVGDKFKGNIKVYRENFESKFKIIANSPKLDIRKYKFLSNKKSNKTPLEINIGSVIINDMISLGNLKGKLNNPDLDDFFSGNLNNGPEIKGSILRKDDKFSVTLNSDKGGEVLQSVGMIKGARGGNMIVDIYPIDHDGNYNGNLTLKNVRIKKAPILADLLSATSVFGLIEQLSGDGILFTDSEAKFVLKPGGILLKQASAVGASLGVSMDGIYDIRRKKVDMQGVISPMYTVNGMLLGKLFAPRDGEGLIGFNYSISGSLENPNVSINPLSIFTPGIFREIFRRPVPKLQK